MGAEQDQIGSNQINHGEKITKILDKTWKN